MARPYMSRPIPANGTVAARRGPDAERRPISVASLPSYLAQDCEAIIMDSRGLNAVKSTGNNTQINVSERIIYKTNLPDSISRGTMQPRDSPDGSALGYSKGLFHNPLTTSSQPFFESFATASVHERDTLQKARQHLRRTLPLAQCCPK